jgi:hypothetical protein
MKRFIEGTDRGQSTLFPECLEDWVDENNPVRVIEVFVDELDLAELGFEGITPEAIQEASQTYNSILRAARLGSPSLVVREGEHCACHLA